MCFWTLNTMNIIKFRNSKYLFPSARGQKGFRVSRFFAHLPVLWENHMETSRKLSIDMFLTMSRLCSVFQSDAICQVSQLFRSHLDAAQARRPCWLLPSIGRFVSFQERPSLEPVTLQHTKSLPLYDIKRNVYELLISRGCIIA